MSQTPFQVGTAINFTYDNTTPILTQPTASGTGTFVGQNLVIQAQPGQQQTGANANNNGGNLILSSGAAGTGGSGAAGGAGNVQLQSAGSTTVEVDSNKLYSLKGFSRSVTEVVASYQVVVTDNVVNVGAITVPITITMPASPNTGDTYLIKDGNGLANTHNIVISGNGANIDGAASYTMLNEYECIELTFTGSVWSVM